MLKPKEIRKGESALHAILPSHFQGVIVPSDIFISLVWQTISFSVYCLFGVDLYKAHVKVIAGYVCDNTITLLVPK